MTYYNTTNRKGYELISGREKAKAQEREILKYFRRRKGVCFHPAIIQQKIKSLSNVPLTSVRRAITNLTKSGKLAKTKYLVEGPYGRACHLWLYRRG